MMRRADEDWSSTFVICCLGVFADEVIPDELFLVDEEEGVYTCGELQV
jgi:hypothetical protein